MKRCTRCILPESWPGIRFDDEGVCHICRAYEKRWGAFLRDPAERERASQKLERLLEWARKHRRGRYDVLVPFGGGKDGLYVLWLLAKRGDLKILSFTGDNALTADHARENVAKAVLALGVAHREGKGNPYQEELMRHFLRKAGRFCAACMIPGVLTLTRLAREEGIPLIVTGFDRRGDALLPHGTSPFYFDRVLDDGFPNPERVRRAMGRLPVIQAGAAVGLGRLKMLSLPDYLPWNQNEIETLLRRELGVTLKEEHSDCVGHELANWLAVKRYGFGYQTSKLSQLIRQGAMTREQALEALPRAEGLDFPEESAAAFASRVGSTREEILAAGERSDERYLGGIPNWLFHQFRAHVAH